MHLRIGGPWFPIHAKYTPRFDTSFAVDLKKEADLIKNKNH